MGLEEPTGIASETSRLRPLLAFRQSTGGAYHALCDAIGIDGIDPQQSMPSATSVNLSVRSNGVTDARVHHTKEQGMKANVNNCAFLSLGDAVQYESAWIGNGRPIIYFPTASNSGHFINDYYRPKEKPRKNLSKFSVDHRNKATNGQNVSVNSNWSQVLQSQFG